MKNPGLYSILLTISFGWVFVSSFNVDYYEPVVMTSGSSGEYFGFSVALHSYGHKKWVLVGAPLANQTAPTGSRYDVHERYGTVYKCTPTVGGRCESVPIDTTDPQYLMYNDQPVNIEEKTGQWLGATLHTTGDNGKVVACAPRYTLQGTFKKNPELRPHVMIGRCFLIWESLSGKYQQIDPCRHSDNTRDIMYGYRQDGFCQAGFAASVFKDGQTLALSAVGDNYGKGTVGVYFPDTEKSLFASSSEIKMDYFGDSMGYALTTGRFMPRYEEHVVGSSTRAKDLKGRVMAFNVIGREKVKVSFTLPLPKDAQIGSSFGHAICAMDLNNDGMSDLLVGAPRYSYEGDEGRVFVYVNNGLGALNIMHGMTLNGDRQPKANFGFSIASAGDLNKDGYNDVVIGAPYGGDDGRGAVYIYHGTSKGVDTKYRQKISASVLGDSKLKSFGFSLTGGVDVDNNKYPDIAVGAYASDRTVLLRTRPIVKVQAKIELSTNQIVLEDNKTSMCDLAEGTRHKCLTARVCFKFSNKMPSSQGVHLSYSLTLDRDMHSDFLRRMFFLGHNTSHKAFIYMSNISLSKQNEWTCEPIYRVYLREKEQIGDLLSPLTFDVNYDLEVTSPCTVCPILDDYDDIRRRSVRATIQFQKQCGKDQECVPDMTVHGSVSFLGGYKDLRIGVSNQMNVSITVGNKADDFAYPGKVIVTYPSLLGYIGTEAKGVQCSRVTTDNKESERAECIVGMPFVGKSKKKFDLIFTTSEIKGDMRQFSIELFATSPSRDADPTNNKAQLLVNVKFEADLSITGSSVPDEVVYNEHTTVSLKDIKKEKDIGPKVSQIIIVRNNGPSAVDGSIVKISVPWRLKKNDPESFLLYLLNVRIDGSAATCDVTTNPLNVKTKNSTNEKPPDIVDKRQHSSVEDQRSKRESKGMECKAEECLTFSCQLGRLDSGDDVKIIMTSRVWQNTLVKENVGSIDLITSAVVTAPASITEPYKGLSNHVTILLRTNPKESKTLRETTPWWIILVSVLAGLILLALVIFILYKCGFFKRNRASKLNDEEEMESKRGYDVASQQDTPEVSRKL